MYLYFKKSGLVIFNLGILSTFLLLSTNMAVAQQQQEEENINNNNSSSRTFYLFPEEIEGLEEEILKIPHDSFSLKTMVAKKVITLLLSFIILKQMKNIILFLINPIIL